ALRGLAPAAGALAATWAAGCAEAPPGEPGRVAAGGAIFAGVFAALALTVGSSRADRRFVREALSRATAGGTDRPAAGL
ncbi:MAG: hypothetical protein L0216_13325, partial [Planctomycetales bacterium]|nr:hypothetical protein [Planctomycetales bacterium]